MAELLHTVAVGRVRYPAGTTATPELRELIGAGHWSDNDGGDPAVRTVPAQLDEAKMQEIADLREMAAQAIADRDARIAELEEQLAELRQAFDPLGTQQKADTQPADPPVDYQAQSGRWLKDEIDRRNDGRDPADEAYIRVDPPSNKPELVAALVADDQRSNTSD